ncbi:MAG: DUF2252 domain-containing protein [Planctomycetota bacterium]|jgi:uncharacterized protein (DUF2252 family)|nr:DUF2252 domain-containing protein [Blastopirellula sp.]
MLQSPFAFYRATALNMAADLASTPTSGLRVQACGDCHLMNFGAFATPERRIIFDINDLDETLPAPWEWDVKRLAASFVLACRDNGFSRATARDSVLSCVRSYRKRMAEYSQLNVLEVWYQSVDAEELLPPIRDKAARERSQKRLAKARKQNVQENEFPELTTSQGQQASLRENLPFVFHPRENPFKEQLRIFNRAFVQYRETLAEDRRLLLDRFRFVDFALNVVGAGSGGTLCGIILLMAGDEDPLFLQVKQARPSVLEAFAGKSAHRNNGQRIVHGCRMLQSASDPFLGWTEGQRGRQFYVRQLKDMKIKPQVEICTPHAMLQYAERCGWTLAHAHARSGEPAKISGYLGKSDKFDEAIADFSSQYADQCERDYELVSKAAKRGKLEVLLEDK